jgi:hypothetical protein
MPSAFSPVSRPGAASTWPFAEKALLDTIYLRKAIPFRDELDLALPDRQRLDLLAKNFPGPTRKLVQELIFPVLNLLS